MEYNLFPWIYERNLVRVFLHHVEKALCDVAHTINIDSRVSFFVLQTQKNQQLLLYFVLGLVRSFLNADKKDFGL